VLGYTKGEIINWGEACRTHQLQLECPKALTKPGYTGTRGKGALKSQFTWNLEAAPEREGAAAG